MFARRRHTRTTKNRKPKNVLTDTGRLHSCLHGLNDRTHSTRYYDNKYYIMTTASAFIANNRRRWFYRKPPSETRATPLTLHTFVTIYYTAVIIHIIIVSCLHRRRIYRQMYIYTYILLFIVYIYEYNKI